MGRPIKAESIKVKGDQCEIERLVSQRIRNDKDLIRICEIDERVWEIDHWICNVWEGFYVPRSVRSKGDQKWIRPSTDHRTTQQFQVKAWFKRKRALITIAEQVEALRKKAEGYAPHYPAIKASKPSSGNLVVLSLYDHHFGGLIWGRETGWEDWDMKLADEAFRDSLSGLIGRIRPYGIDRIMLVLGNDLQNADNRAGTTEAGTVQSNDSRYQKVCEKVQATAVWAVEACLGVAPRVDVPMIYGNHDPLTTFHLGGYLKAWFRNCKGVEVQNEPTARKYFQHGKTMLMLTHGQQKMDFPHIMAAERPAMWSETSWRETHTGHIHTKRALMDEVNGVIVRSLPSLRPPCEWSTSKGYVGNVRSAEAYAYNAEEGLIGSATVSRQGEKRAA